jgi:hypothetical protein
MARTGSPPVLDAEKKAKVLEVVGAGFPIRYAARYVGCDEGTIRHAGQRDPEWRAQEECGEESPAGAPPSAGGDGPQKGVGREALGGRRQELGVGRSGDGRPAAAEQVPAAPAATEAVAMPSAAGAGIPAPSVAAEQVATPPAPAEEVPAPPVAAEQVPAPPVAAEQVASRPVAAEQVPAPPAAVEWVGHPEAEGGREAGDRRQEPREGADRHIALRFPMGFPATPNARSAGLTAMHCGLPPPETGIPMAMNDTAKATTGACRGFGDSAPMKGP